MCVCVCVSECDKEMMKISWQLVYIMIITVLLVYFEVWLAVVSVLYVLVFSFYMNISGN